MILILIAAVLWGFVGVATRPLYDMGLTVIELTLVRSVASFLGALLMILFTNTKDLKIQLRDIPLFICAGAFSIDLFNICYFLTQQIFTLALSSVFLYTAPCFVMILSAIIFHDRLTAQKLIALAAALCGCFLASGAWLTSSEITAFGVMIGLLSGFGYALYSIFGSLAAKRYSGLTFMLYTFFFAALTLLPFCNTNKIAICASNGGMIWLVAFTLLFTVIPYMLYSLGLERIEASRASILAFAEPFVSALAGLLFFDESLSLELTIGMLLMLLGIIIIARHKKSREH
ncbi:MAG: DMT family transporter [Ruminococcus sp.]|nr:DMT family transporter [Ruminococcus sp.]